MPRPLATAVSVGTVWFGDHRGRETILKEKGFAVTHFLRTFITPVQIHQVQSIVRFWHNSVCLEQLWTSLGTAGWSPQGLHGLPSLVTQNLLTISPGRAALLVPCLAVFHFFFHRRLSHLTAFERSKHICVWFDLIYRLQSWSEGTDQFLQLR